MFLLNDKPLAVGVPFTHKGVQYPANWLRLSTLEEKTAIGIVEIPDPVYPDTRYYWVTDHGNGNISKEPKDLDLCKAWRIAEVKTGAAIILAQSDWKVIRAVETNTALSEDVKIYRASIRTKSNLFETQINSCQTVEELEALQTDFNE